MPSAKTHLYPSKQDLISQTKSVALHQRTQQNALCTPVKCLPFMCWWPFLIIIQKKDSFAHKGSSDLHHTNWQMLYIHKLPVFTDQLSKALIRELIKPATNNNSGKSLLYSEQALYFLLCEYNPDYQTGLPFHFTPLFIKRRDTYLNRCKNLRCDQWFTGLEPGCVQQCYTVAARVKHGDMELIIGYMHQKKIIHVLCTFCSLPMFVFFVNETAIKNKLPLSIEWMNIVPTGTTPAIKLFYPLLLPSHPHGQTCLKTKSVPLVQPRSYVSAFCHLWHDKWWYFIIYYSHCFFFASK